MNGIKKFIFITTLCLIAISGSCGRRNLKIQDSQSAPEEIDLTEIINILGKKDAQAFSSLCVYPILRDYPLHDIADSVQMMEYYDILVDDSLRNVINRSSPTDWQEIGWRGATLHNGEYLWLDPYVYAVNYYSDKEKALKKHLVEEDLNSLPSDLAEGWIPHTCLYDSVNSNVYRIDLLESEEVRQPCRLMIYSDSHNLKKRPDTLMDGFFEIQGSMSIPTYSFSSRTGEVWDIIEYWFDDRRILTIYDDSTQSEHPLRKIYWLDIIKE